MMNKEFINNQMQLTQKAIAEMKKTNRIFEQMIQDAVKGARKEDQQKLEEFRLLTIKVQNLAKQGKIEEAQNLIKDFSNERQNNTKDL